MIGLKAAVAGTALLGLFSSAAIAHTIPWRAGELRMKGVGHCAKGPCMKRADFSASKPHHHHGAVVVMGSNRHSAACRWSIRNHGRSL